MKAKIKSRGILGSILLPGLLMAQITFGQTNLQFTSVNVTDEGAIQLHFASQPNHLYEVDEADSLIDTNTGSTTWNKLYDDYPSQGTNTFIGDFGNYNLAPQILHPKNSPMRFYRILDEGQDSLASDEPTVSIISPTNDAVTFGELTIAVVAATDQPVISGTKLYVDGQEMQMADSTTNYTDGSTNYEMDTYSINTCEWGNETHILFATAECESGFGDIVGTGPIATGHGASPFVPILFNNLVTRISFSLPSFDPSSGQTQQVSAVFAANSDWTLNIVDVYSNVVQTATGSGTSLLYNWDGTSNGTNLPNGIYYYYITAQTNGESDEIEGGGSGGSGGGSPPSPSFASDSLKLWAMPTTNSESVVPLAIYPPGFDTNNLFIFPASQSEIQGLFALSDESLSGISSGAVDSDDVPITPLPDPQPAPSTPQRPPNNPVRGLTGTFGIAYDTYSANGTNDMNAPLLGNGLLGTGHISMNNYQAGQQLPFPPLLPYKIEAKSFVSEMQHWGWNNTINKADDQLNINDLRGSGSPFNNVTLGVLLLHGAYGNGMNAIDYAANGCKQMYLPITSGGSINWLRISEMNLGGSGANGLKWMAIHACNSLQHNNWANMQSLGVKPYNSNLHLLLGCDTISYTGNVLWYWSQYMNYGTSTNRGNYDPLTIREAWYQGAQKAFQGKSLSGPIVFAVAGDTACVNDKLQTNNAPTGTWTYDSRQIYP